MEPPSSRARCSPPPTRARYLGSYLKAQADLNAPTAFFVLAWDAFRAPVFSYDEALRLVCAVGVDLEQEIVNRLAEKKARNPVRQGPRPSRPPEARRDPPDPRE